MIRKKNSFLRRFLRDPAGAVAVEFVLIAPILFALLLGIITLGYFMGVSHSVGQLATGAARASVAGLDQIERQEIAAQYLSEAGSRYPLLVPDNLTFTETYEATAPTGLTIAVSYDVTGTLLDVANGFLGLNITTIDGSAYLAY